MQEELYRADWVTTSETDSDNSKVFDELNKRDILKDLYQS